MDFVVDDVPDARGFCTIRFADGSPHGDTELPVVATVYAAEYANLLAAAPDLLAELDGLQEMAACVVGNRDNGSDFDRALNNLDRLAEKARKTIARIAAP